MSVFPNSVLSLFPTLFGNTQLKALLSDLRQASIPAEHEKRSLSKVRSQTGAWERVNEKQRRATILTAKFAEQRGRRRMFCARDSSLSRGRSLPTMRDARCRIDGLGDGTA